MLSDLAHNQIPWSSIVIDEAIAQAWPQNAKEKSEFFVVPHNAESAEAKRGIPGACHKVCALLLSGFLSFSSIVLNTILVPQQKMLLSGFLLSMFLGL